MRRGLQLVNLLFGQRLECDMFHGPDSLGVGLDDSNSALVVQHLMSFAPHSRNLKLGGYARMVCADQMKGAWGRLFTL